MRRMMKRLLGRKGEEFVEAAIVLPLMILTILSMIMIAVFMYRHCLRQAETHEELMKEALLSKSVFAVKRKNVSDSDRIRGTYTANITEDGSFRVYAIRQADAVRIGSLTGKGNVE